MYYFNTRIYHAKISFSVFIRKFTDKDIRLVYSPYIPANRFFYMTKFNFFN